MLRGIREKLYIDNGRYRVDEIDEDSNIIINNFNRESSVYLSLGVEKDASNIVRNNFNLGKAAAIRNYDNSRFIASDKGCFKGAVSREYEAPISSPMFHLNDSLDSMEALVV